MCAQLRKSEEIELFYQRLEQSYHSKTLHFILRIIS